MPRKNKRKVYTTGKETAFFGGNANNSGYKPECVGCAFAGYGFICTTSDGVCLKTNAGKPERSEVNNAGRQR